MSGSFDPGANAYLAFSAGSVGAAGTGAHTIAVLFKTAEFNANTGLVGLYASSTLTRELLADSGALFGLDDFTSGFGTVAVDTWYVAAITKPSGSQHYRCHLWPYASDGSGTMSHGEASGAANHGDGSTITAIRIGFNDIRGNGLIAVVAVADTVLSDANLDTLKSANLSAWAALAFDEIIQLENWDGSTGAVIAVGSCTFTAETGTVASGANPPSFNFALGTNATATPNVITGAASVPSPTVTAQTNATATPSAVTGAASVPGPTITAQTNATATPSAVAGAATVPTPAVSTGTNATATPGVITGSASVPAPTIAAASNATATPVVVTGAATVPAPTVSAASNATATLPAMTAGVAVPAPIVSAIANATVLAPLLALSVMVRQPTVRVGANAEAGRRPNVVTSVNRRALTMGSARGLVSTAPRRLA